ncbi:MAG: bifunctional methylenetetrahydrofolate dehydrogenase/methenyltetrahydrofolate cyclohydrolase FolD [Spirochaetota bacterium]|jgi:methylenetetrahydrofolate dehydrogenase (NADP+)/methenyltetrahydrofolate cyclohydrolase|nr:bifunctional methylenetetrahydrofolate dehydrogenase/methenyltetrahydrofolate cyclohydrolase FolD [Spirochaetota bacterium]
MSARLLSGKEAAAKVFDEVKSAMRAFTQPPSLAVVQVGSDPASGVYVNMKEKRCLECGIRSAVFRLPENTTETELSELISKLNSDQTIDAFLIQLPLPEHINEARMLELIRPDKDADCFHPYNFGRLAAGNPLVLPCTPAGVLVLLDHYGIEIEGKRALVIGRSNIAGKPLGLMLLARHASVTWAHSRTRNLPDLCREAELIFAAVGKPNFLTADMVSPGAVVVDVGINRVPSGDGYVLRGDVDFEAVSERASWITPVPGGVGAMTIAMLLSNCVALARARL